MLKIEEIESVCSSGRPHEVPSHVLDLPDFSFEETFYPHGFPVTVRSNSGAVLEQYREMWGKFAKLRDTDPIAVDVYLAPSDSTECPPEPSYLLMLPLMVTVADKDNFSVVDLDRCTASIKISQAAMAHPLYVRCFLLGSPGHCISTNYATVVHSGCVALQGRGVLLCGDSGAGKSTLSYACARSGWTFVTDDASLLLNGGTERMVTGDCHKVRFRPAARAIFPELKGLEITPRATGKPSIELPLNGHPIARAQTVRVDHVVFLNRRAGGTQELVPYRKEVARMFIRQTLMGSAVARAAQYAAIEQLLTLGVLELRYTSLEWAVERLRTLVENGR
ncbi:MAG: aldolase [Terracidiphilus sp.]